MHYSSALLLLLLLAMGCHGSRHEGEEKHKPDAISRIDSIPQAGPSADGASDQSVPAGENPQPESSDTSSSEQSCINEPTEEDYLVYSAVLNGYNPHHECSLIISREISAIDEKAFLAYFTLNPEDELTDFFRNYKKRMKEFLFEHLEGLEEETFNDYFSKVNELTCLSSNFNITKDYVVLESEKINSFFKGSTPDELWDNFYQDNPEACGYLELGVVGYNSSKTQALAKYSYMQHSLSAKGLYVLLIKENGSWKIIGECVEWIS